jgi:zinc D-Ala-D-Ala carboxypeptidase
MNLSEHFTLDELTHTDHRSLTIPQMLLRWLTLCAWLRSLRKSKRAIGGKPVMVNSAFRCKQVNDAVGSKDTSQHRIGCAADISVPGMTPDEVVKAVIASGIGYDQIIREFDRWTHISVPNTKDMTPRRQALIIDKSGTRTFS